MAGGEWRRCPGDVFIVSDVGQGGVPSGSVGRPLVPGGGGGEVSSFRAGAACRFPGAVPASPDGPPTRVVVVGRFFSVLIFLVFLL